ncbi:hypothetical protein SAMN05518849_10214 [Sphingobium sp. AP50]|uniref:hypothetical protein n=1 Tax=Sphingobium sp. AP50 TaxID=1884369 RepID=UPI0008B51C52|nr:hypothetical protein [Sphingobium sp. AP50]SEI96381.1 hypothetical protein SAMN05518849_10214 [Sphingobium sp. AP50]
MLKLLRHLLCLGLLFGLAGNGVAVAAPCILMTQGQSAIAMADMPDCSMAKSCADCSAKSDASHKSGKDKAPGCMAMTACAAMLAMKTPDSAGATRHQATAHQFSPSTAMLAGRDVAPEPEPPTLLG